MNNALFLLLLIAQQPPMGNNPSVTIRQVDTVGEVTTWTYTDPISNNVYFVSTPLYTIRPGDKAPTTYFPPPVVNIKKASKSCLTTKTKVSWCLVGGVMQRNGKVVQ